MISSARLIRSVVASLRSRGVRAGTCACLAVLVGSTAAAAPQSGTEASRPGARSARAGDTTQDTRVVKPDTPDATREELVLLLDQSLRDSAAAGRSGAERARASETASTIRRRLEEGDFKPGDRFILTTVIDTVSRMEMLVREGPALEFGSTPPLPIAGVLRSELPGALRQYFGRYFRNVDVRVQHLTRVSLAGAVGRPGTYAVPPYALVSDVVMQAGGPLASADPDKIVVTRGGRVIVDEKAYRRAVTEGYTIERLGIQPGDEIRVGDRGRRNWGQVVMYSVFALTAFTSILALIRSSYAE